MPMAMHDPAGEKGPLPDAAQSRRHHRNPQLRQSLLRRRRPYREETALSLPSHQQGLLSGRLGM